MKKDKATDAYDVGDNETALKGFRKLAEQGDAEAQLYLATLYKIGDLDNVKVDKVDYKEALKWYRLAAEQGDVSGQNCLASMYQSGEGITQDYKEAVKWYRLAAEQGDKYAQWRLGKMYEKGEGVEQDIVIAYMWYSIAIFSGDEVHTGLVRYDINRIESKMTPEQILKANKLTREYIKKSR